MAATHILVADDHATVRHGLSVLLGRLPDCVVVGTAATVAEALRIAEQHRIDVAVIDSHLPDGSGYELFHRLRSRQPSMRCVIHAPTPPPWRELEQAGDATVVLKQLDGAALVAAVVAESALTSSRA